MKTPPLLLGAALMFWGWQNGFLILAAVMACIYECADRVRWRWNLTAENFRQLVKVLTVLLVVMLLIAALSKTEVYFLYVLLRWLPILFFPLLAAQAYSTGELIDFRSLFLFRGKSKKNTRDSKKILFHPSYPFFGLCLLSAAATQSAGGLFYIGLVLLVAAALWRMRSRQSSVLIWLVFLGLAGVIGLAVHSGLHTAHIALEEKGLEWLSNSGRQDADPFRTRTAIGDIGSLKPSDRILFRVTADDLHRQSMLLQEAAYNVYSFGTWFASPAAFKPLQPDAGLSSWQFAREPQESKSLTVTTILKEGRGVLKMPAGAYRVDQLPAVSLERNRFGTVKMEGAPRLVSYRVRYTHGQVPDSPPLDMDLHIPDRNRPVIDKFAGELGIKKTSPKAVLIRLSEFFEDNFTYSLEANRKTSKRDPLTDFLENHRSGHCEYFATATVLLLRAAGIPARYARGYSLHEFSHLENRFIVRDRHAHAWALARIDGKWITMDTTPASWRATENAQTPTWRKAADVVSFGWLQIVNLVQYLQDNLDPSQLWWGVIPVIVLGGIRMMRNRKMRKSTKVKPPDVAPEKTETYPETEFECIEKALNQLGYVRHPSETLAHWLSELRRRFPEIHLFDGLERLMMLHYRLRFDPDGIRQAERHAFEVGIRKWLEDNKQVT